MRHMLLAYPVTTSFSKRQ